MTDPIKKLAEIYPTLENGHKAAAREVKASIEEMQARILDLESTLERRELPEAPASATVRIEYKGYDILFTLRDSAGTELLKKLEGAIVHFEKLGIKPANGQSPRSANVASGDAPSCPTHNKPMKPSGQGAGWYCPVKVAETGGGADGSKPIYCKAKAG